MKKKAYNISDVIEKQVISSEGAEPFPYICTQV